MRTLLTDSFPPQGMDEPGFSVELEPPAEPAAKAARTFPSAAVLASEKDLMEVGVDGTAMATPGASSAE
jgi:hypothetical protein